ncbi:hypothetical protein ACHAXR_002085, partial [Thalassiosira sp. AJA248-18]
YCQLLNPEWEELASKVKGFVKIAYWDTEKSGSAPNILGEIRGTPTIKLIKPKRKAKTNKQKDVVDYNMERKADDMSSFALDLMPSFVERVNGPEDFEKFKNKAKKFGLPMMLFFSEDRRILNEMKFLSTEFRRRVLIAQIPFTKKENKNLFFEYGVRGRALLVVPPSSADGDEQDEFRGDNQSPDVVVFDGKWSLHRLQSFFSEHALKTEVKPKPAEAKTEDKEDKQTEPAEKEKVKTEL